MKHLFVILSSIFLLNELIAQENETSKWAIETSLTFPIVQIYQFHFAYRFNEKSEFLVGPCFQNFDKETFSVNAYTLLLGYRYYIWRNLHLENELYPAYNKIYSTLDQKYYDGFEAWNEIRLGYHVFLINNKLYIEFAPGIGFGIFRQNKPPNFDKEMDAITFVPQINLGFKF
ncbi:MAG: hypothetical protein WC611_08955 [Candidatus Neomarinimicrobiota bacterium]